MKKVLTIAGSDSGSGAGIQADLKTFAAMKVYGCSVITAVTAQNTVGVRGIHTIPAEFVSLQLDAVLEDIHIDAVKTGMLAGANIIETVGEKLKQHSITNLVVDPVLVATSGDFLTDEGLDGLVDALKSILFPLAAVVTPNVPEAEQLAGMKINTFDDMREAALKIKSFGPAFVVVKGGHILSDDALDILYDGNEFYEYIETRVSTENTHGTGCTFASALAAGLARGLTVYEAVAEAKQFVQCALKHSFKIGKGRGPTHHFGELYSLLDGEVTK